MNKITKITLVFIATLSGVAGYAQSPVNRTIQLITTVQKAKPRITFSWGAVAGATGFQVYRKLKTGIYWGGLKATLPANATGYVDSTISIGTEYEYKIYGTGTDTATTYVCAGIEVPVTEARGKMILLVDSTFTDSLRSGLVQLEKDLIGDGWTVIRRDVGRNMSSSAVKEIIQKIYYSDPANVKSVFIFGHVPVPYSGDINPDGHPDHMGAWPCDDYYADMDSAWTDVTVDDTSASRKQNWNKPGDGKFDQSALYQMGSDLVELQVGRVDLSNLPSFPSTETQLLRQYLVKDHAYKFKIINPRRQAFVADNFGSYNQEYFASTGWRNFAALFNAANITENDAGYFSVMDTGSYLFSYGCGGGTYTSAGGIGSTTDFVNDSVHAVFSMLFGSYFGDWDSQDDFLRAPLASKGWTLTDCWAGRPYWEFQYMGLGETVGYCAKMSENSDGSLYVTNPVYPWLGQLTHVALMGDPSLRLHVIAPPSNLVGADTVNKINLSWMASAASDSVLGYYMYRLDTTTQVYLRISPNIIASLNFTDNSPLNGRNYYMVRAIRLEKAASGTYYNLSQGVFDTMNIILNAVPQVVKQHVEMLVYPNPANDNANVKFNLAAGERVKLTLINVLGEEVIELANKEFSAGEHAISFKVSTLAQGIYYLRLQTNNSPDSFKKLIISGH